MKKKTKICFRCKKPINLDKDEYYSFHEHKKLRVIKIDYAHRVCWDDFLKQIGDTTEAMSMLRRMKEPLTTMGLLKPEEVYLR